MDKTELTIEELVEHRTLFKNVSLRYLVAKRLFDLAVSFLGITLLLPVFIVTAVVLKVKSRKPVFLTRICYGYKGKAFKLYRFRTNMYGVNKLLQLFNVLKGDMSIVGPKPINRAKLIKYRSWYSLRLSAKPGITGLWQISGNKETSFSEMVRLDLKYIRERSLLYDIKIVTASVYKAIKNILWINRKTREKLG